MCEIPEFMLFIRLNKRESERQESGTNDQIQRKASRQEQEKKKLTRKKSQEKNDKKKRRRALILTSF